MVKLDQFHETEIKHSNLRSGDLHTPLRMLHRALGKTDLQVPGAHLFFCFVLVFFPLYVSSSEERKGRKKGFLIIT